MRIFPLNIEKYLYVHVNVIILKMNYIEKEIYFY